MTDASQGTTDVNILWKLMMMAVMKTWNTTLGYVLKSKVDDQGPLTQAGTVMMHVGQCNTY